MVNLNPNQPAQGSFLPEDYVRGKGEQKANVAILLLFGAVLVGTVGVFVFNVQRQRALAQEVRQVRAEFETESIKIEQLRGLETQRAELLDRAEVVNAISEKIPRSILMAELWRDMPKDLRLETVELEGKRISTAPVKSASPAGRRGTLAPGQATPGVNQPAPKVLPPKFEHHLELVGLSGDNEKIADYVASLRRSPLFSSVDVSSIERKEVEDEFFRKFTITMKLAERVEFESIPGVVETTLLEGFNSASVFGDE